MEVPDKLAEVLELKERCQFIASRLVNAESLLYIGRGLDYALSMEGSLKLKEISIFLEMNESNVKNILYRTLKEIRDFFAKEGDFYE